MPDKTAKRVSPHLLPQAFCHPCRVWQPTYKAPAPTHRLPTSASAPAFDVNGSRACTLQIQRKSWAKKRGHTRTRAHTHTHTHTHTQSGNRSWSMQLLASTSGSNSTPNLSSPLFSDRRDKNSIQPAAREPLSRSCICMRLLVGCEKAGRAEEVACSHADLSSILSLPLLN